MKTSLPYLILLLSPSLVQEVSALSPMRAGIAIVDITPPLGTLLGGFEKSRRAEKVHDSLFARILVLKTPETAVALVSSDLHRLQSPSLVNRIRNELGIAHTILLSSQTRAAPSLDPDTRHGAWGQEVESKIFQQVKLAHENLFSAKILFGQGALMGAHNIRVFQDDGTVQDRWENPKEEGTAPIDPAVRVIRIDHEREGPKAILVHYSCEPAVLGPGNQEVSADFPGAMSRYVEGEFGRGVVCFFLAAASANIYPFKPGLDGPEGFSEVAKMGQRLGREALRVSRSVGPSEWENQLRAEEQVLPFRNRWNSSRKMEVTIGTVFLNKSLALVAVPGSLFLEFQLLLNAKSPVTALLLSGGFSGGTSWAGIIPPIIQAAEGGFGASYATDVEVGSGEAIIDQAAIGLYRFLGKLDDLPRGVLVHEIPDLASP
jgi:neutral ceramidase